MTIAFIADLHLTPQRPAALKLFQQFLRGAARRLECVYILGDLFDYWVGDDGATALGQHEVETALREATSAGTRIYFMHGNRDFLIGDDFAERSGCEILPDPAIINPGRRMLLTHGDALCTDDTEHMRAREQMLSAKWKRAFLEKPLAARLHAATDLRARSEENKRHKSMTEMDVNQTAVENLMRRHQTDTMIHGHTHQPAVHHFHLDGKPAWRYVLGDWYEGRSAIYFADGRLGLRK